MRRNWKYTPGGMILRLNQQSLFWPGLTGRAFDPLPGAREAKAWRLQLDGQALDRRAPEQCWPSQMLLSPQPRHHAILSSPKVRKILNVGREHVPESMIVGQDESTLVKISVTDVAC
jgi:hypothetical protein